MSDQLAEIFQVNEAALVLDDVHFAWRAALEEEDETYRAWCQGVGTYEAFVAALDREQAAAYALDLCRRGEASRTSGKRGRRS